MRLTLSDDVPAGPDKGDVVRFTVAEDVKIGDLLVFAKGAPASGVVAESGRKGLFGRKNKLNVLLDSAEAVDGTNVHLRGSVAPQDVGKARKSTELLPLNGKELKDKDIAAQKGISVDAFVNGGTQVTPRKAR